VHVLAAPDKFRGSIGAVEVAAAIADGVARAGWSCKRMPLADGGEGTLDVLGGANRTSTVTGPLGAPVEAVWRLEGEWAVIESARASGLALVGGKDANDPLVASTRGTGELILRAIEAGAREIVVCAGGSASTDGGSGALQALSWTPFPARGVEVRVACDVQTRFLDAASVFAPQKGADSRQVQLLLERLRTLAARYRRELGVDVESLPRAGAAGGLAGGLAALGAELVAGFELVAEALELDVALARANLAITAEGKLDETSFGGKVVGGVLAHASRLGIPVAAIAGEVDAGAAGQLAAVSLLEQFGPARAWGETARCISEATALLLGRRPVPDPRVR
jgi:glycerate kinase